MFEYKGINENASEGKWKTYTFGKTPGSMFDRFWWGMVFTKDLTSPEADWKAPGSDEWQDGDKLPKDFTIWRVRGYNKILGCVCGFVYCANGSIQLTVDTESCRFTENGIVAYMENVMQRRHYAQGWDESTMNYNRKFKEKTGIEIEDAIKILEKMSKKTDSSPLN